MPTALVVGGAQCVWDDARFALSMFEPDAFFVVNDMMRLWPLRIDYGVTLHPNKIGEFVRGRRGNKNFQIWSNKYFGEMVHKTTPDWAGSSGLFAVKIAKQEGFNAIVLVGVPLVSTEGHIVRKKVWTSADMFQRGWKKHLAEIAPVARSLSGWTKLLLGEPTPQWLQEAGSAPPKHELVLALQEKGDARIKDTA